MLELLSQSPAAWIVLAGVVGLVVGSFLNVVIHRLPVMLERQWREQCQESQAASAGAGAPAASPAATAGRYNLVVPRSACPACHAPISAWQNIPVLSWLWLRGRCARCAAPISLRYPLIELLCALLSAAVAWRFGFGWNAIEALAVTWALLALTGIDLDTQYLPDAITLPLLWAGLLASLGAAGAAGAGGIAVTSLPVGPADAITGAAAGYLSLWSMYHLFRLLTGKEGMGYGDFKLLAALGAWMGWRMLLPIILASAFTGAVVGIALIASGRHKRGVPIPFGPFLAAAGWLALMWGPQWVSGYLGLYAHY
ncbi:MAG: prepilin peptidase [Gammaproteobacteria bacterium]|nr:prepilin peptidase [Gammaproteobacteria bacterium]